MAGKPAPRSANEIVSESVGVKRIPPDKIFVVDVQAFCRKKSWKLFSVAHGER